MANNKCQHQCVNTIGSFYCQCRKGYQLDEVTGRCYDIDECEFDSLNNCGENSKCVNTVGGFYCKCLEGFDNGPNNQCVDINECSYYDMQREIQAVKKATRGVADQNSSSANNDLEMTSLQNSYHQYNFILAKVHGAPCSDEKMHTCVNTLGSFECLCPEGYETNPQSGLCQNINECLVHAPDEICHENEICVDLDGSYRCDCAEGFKREVYNNTDSSSLEMVCVDVDECNQVDDFGNKLPNPCNTITSECVNVKGGFQCKCKVGFKNSIDYWDDFGENLGSIFAKSAES